MTLQNKIQTRARVVLENFRKVSAKAPKPFFNVAQEGNAATIRISGPIDSWWGVDVADLIAEIEALDVSLINVRIASPGGNVFEGTELMTALAAHPAEVHTYNDSLAASMASGLLMSGSKVHAAENALFMIHDPMFMFGGNAREFREAADLLDKVGGVLAKNYSKQTSARDGLTHEQVMEAMHAETWYTADEALAAGFIDEIIDTIPDVATNRGGVLNMYRNTPDNLKDDAAPADVMNIETVREFEAFLRDVGGFSNTAAKAIAAAGFALDQRDAAGVDEQNLDNLETLINNIEELKING